MELGNQLSPVLSEHLAIHVSFPHEHEKFKKNKTIDSTCLHYEKLKTCILAIF